MSCDICHIACDSCNNSSIYCDRCNNGFEKNWLGKCVAICPSVTHFDRNTKKCKNCTQPCKDCYNSTSFKTCLINAILNNSTGESNYNDGYFMNVSNECENCSNCKLNSTLRTQSTLNTRKLKSVEECEDGAFLDNNNECKSCKKLGKYLMNKSCVDKCPPFYYFDSNYICLDCFESNRSIFGDSCVEVCPDMLISLNKECIPDPFLSKQCVENMCLNYGKCSFIGNTTLCDCQMMYEGEFCQNNIELGK
jgi:hypothetical protein